MSIFGVSGDAATAIGVSCLLTEGATCAGAAFGFAALMGAADAADAPAGETAATLAGDTILPLAFARYGADGLVAGLAFQLFWDEYVSIAGPILEGPNPPLTPPQPSPKVSGPNKK